MAPKAATSSSLNRQLPIRVLVAESDKDVRALLGWLLNDDGRFVVVAEAANGDDALACQVPFDLALVDLRISGLGGLGTVARLHRRVPRPTVVVLSETGPTYLRHAATEEGAAGFFLRPEDIQSLPDHLAELAGTLPVPG